jgi:DNA-binding Lrp family transcriptional regulator
VSVNIFVEPEEKDNVVEALASLENTEEIYEVAGEYDIVSLISASSIEEIRQILHQSIMKLKGVKSTITTIILEPHKGRWCMRKKLKDST